MQSNQFVDAHVADLVKPVETFSSSDPLTRVIGYLKQSKEYDAFIEDGGGASIVSVRDILNVENIATEKITHIMKRVPKLSESDTITTAAKLMFENRLRSLPVYDGRKLSGSIGSASIANAVVSANHPRDLVGRIATPEPICVDVYDSAAKAKRIMVDRKIDQLPILKEKRFAGVITSDSIAFRIVAQIDHDQMGAPEVGRMDADVMALSEELPVTNEVTDSLGQTLENMRKMGSNYSVILNGDEVQGIVTYRDFLKLLPPKTTETLVSIQGLPEDPLQSEMAKTKFENSVALLAKTMPNMIEAKAVIKSGETKAPKKRYQVKVLIASADSQYNYEVFSFDLAKAFEEIEIWIKTLASRGLERRQKGKRRETGRKASIV